VEELISDFENILKMSEPSTSQNGANKRLHINSPQEHHQAITNNTMLSVGDLIKQIVNFELNPLREEIVNLRSQLSHKIKSVEDYQIEIIDPNIKCDTSYEIIKSVREYKGEEDKYVSWRESAEIAMGKYARGSERFYSALSILRNNITGTANDALTHNGTVLIFDAIMARLDFVFSDKRPIHIIEQELSVLSQGKLFIMDY